MTAAPLLSIVLETTTELITGRRSVADALDRWIEAAEAACPGRWEVVVATANEPRVHPEDPRIRIVVARGRVYYGLKNAGFNAARGSYVLFGDADCRPGSGYVGHVLRAFEATGAACLAGRSYYDGGGLGARICSAISFGPLHRPDPRAPLIPLAHNVALRRSAVAHDPFGPYIGRTGGDRYLASTLYSMGTPPLLIPEMVIFHENRAFSLRATLDRHLREAFDYPFLRSGPAKAWARQALKGALLGLPRHMREFSRFRTAFGLGRWTFVPAFLLQASAAPLEVLATSLLLAVPRLRESWARYDFGRSEEELRAFVDSPAHRLTLDRWREIVAERRLPR